MIKREPQAVIIELIYRYHIKNVSLLCKSIFTPL